MLFVLFQHSFYFSNKKHKTKKLWTYNTRPTNKKPTDKLTQVYYLTLLKYNDSDFESLQGFSVQLVFALDLSCGSIDLQPALSVTIQFKTVQHTRRITHKDMHTTCTTSTLWQTLNWDPEEITVVKTNQ